MEISCPEVHHLLLNQQDHSWIIWILFSFTMGGHGISRGNLNPKSSTFLLYMVGLTFSKTICPSCQTRIAFFNWDMSKHFQSTPKFEWSLFCSVVVRTDHFDHASWTESCWAVLQRAITTLYYEIDQYQTDGVAWRQAHTISYEYIPTQWCDSWSLMKLM
jgi:hypothetical protein